MLQDDMFSEALDAAQEFLSTMDRLARSGGFYDSLQSALASSYTESHFEWGRVDASPAIIQQRFLPSETLRLEGMEFSAMCRQADMVGGDFYDLPVLPNGELGIAIGDVCGKGVAAALMMAHLQATLRTEIRHATADLPVLMATVNRLFHESSLEQLYSTLFFASYNPATRAVKYVNAGHPPPLIVRQNRSEIEWLDCGGVPVGMFTDSVYGAGSATLNPGDVLIAYTDGIVESPDVSGEHWGVERLVYTAIAIEDRTAIQFNTAITKAVDAFSSGVKDRDDMALAILRAL